LPLKFAKAGIINSVMVVSESETFLGDSIGKRLIGLKIALNL